MDYLQLTALISTQIRKNIRINVNSKHNKIRLFTDKWHFDSNKLFKF